MAHAKDAFNYVDRLTQLPIKRCNATCGRACQGRKRPAPMWRRRFVEHPNRARWATASLCAGVRPGRPIAGDEEALPNAGAVHAGAVGRAASIAGAADIDAVDQRALHPLSPLPVDDFPISHQAASGVIRRRSANSANAASLMSW